METRVLGRSGLEVSALGLGCMNMTGPYGLTAAAAKLQLIGDRLPKAFLDLTER